MNIYLHVKLESLISLGSACIDFQCVMLQNRLYQALALELVQRSASQRSPDLQPLTDDSWSNEFIAGNFLTELVIRDLVKESQIVQLVPHFSF